MKRELNFWLLGGDLRQGKLAQALLEDGHRVHLYGLEQLPEGKSLPMAESLRGIGGADCVILPLPLVGEQGLLNAPYSDLRLPVAAALEALKPGQTVCGGKVPPALAAQAAERGITLVDYFAREELAVANAAPTAEGAIQIAMEELPVTLAGARVLVIGFGRVGKMLALRLKGLGARVTVSARRYEDLAWVRALGCAGERTDQLAGWLCGYDLIINTVPARVLTGHMMTDLSPGCLVIDLASKPGGVDMEAAAALGVKVIWALSLPGKVAPVTSGKIIRDTIYHILEEGEEA